MCIIRVIPSSLLLCLGIILSGFGLPMFLLQFSFALNSLGYDISWLKHASIGSFIDGCLLRFGAEGFDNERGSALSVSKATGSVTVYISGRQCCIFARPTPSWQQLGRDWRGSDGDCRNNRLPLVRSLRILSPVCRAMPDSGSRQVAWAATGRVNTSLPMLLRFADHGAVGAWQMQMQHGQA